jgi:hypothetical protein
MTRRFYLQEDLRYPFDEAAWVPGRAWTGSERQKATFHHRAITTNYPASSYTSYAIPDHVIYPIGKSKVYLIPCHEGTKREKRYSSTLSLTSALDWGGWLTPRSRRFTS